MVKRFSPAQSKMAARRRLSHMASQTAASLITRTGQFQICLPLFSHLLWYQENTSASHQANGTAVMFSVRVSWHGTIQHPMLYIYIYILTFCDIISFFFSFACLKERHSVVEPITMSIHIVNLCLHVSL